MKADLRHVNRFSNQGFKQRMLAVELPPKSERELSFKGVNSLLNKQVVRTVDETLTQVLDGRYGKMLDEFEKLTEGIKLNQTIKRPAKGVGEIAFNERTMLGKALDSITYFCKDLWLDIANGTLTGLKKHKFIEESSVFKKVYNSKVLKNHRNANAANELFYSILGMTNKHQDFLAKSQELLSRGEKEIGSIDYIYRDFVNESINKPIGAYSAKNERALNRLATGAVSALFVGRDFYNLTMYQTNDKNEAKKSEKKRFKQEMTRIATSAFLSFSVLGIFSKWTNKSILAAAGATAATTLIAEITSRIKNGVPLTPLTPKKAKEIHDKKKENVSYKGQEKTANNANPQTSNPENAFAANELTNINSFISAVKENPQNLKLNQTKLNNQTKNNELNQPKTSVFKKVGKIIGATLLIGFGWDLICKYGIKNAKKLMLESNSKVLKFIANFKENVFYKDRKVPKDVMHNIIEAVRKSGNEEIANSYTANLGALDKNGCYTIGKIDRKLAIPLRIPEKIMDAIKIPYNGLSRLFHHTPSWVNTTEKTDIEQLKNAMGVLYDEVSRRKVSPEELSKIVERRINSLFNDNSIIKYKQSDLALLNRTFVTTIASYFFINDFRNQVLIDSAGQDTQRAEEVTNERLGHKLTNFVTNAFWMNFFNTTFSKTVMGSLLGATAISAFTELSNESTIRYSIGVPIKKMESKEAIQEFEAKNYYNKGLYGKWIRFFSKLTGKKPISEKAKNS